jgi:hypothetical protein
MVSIESERSQSACQPRASGFFVEKTQPPTVLCFACGTSQSHFRTTANHTQETVAIEGNCLGLAMFRRLIGLRCGQKIERKENCYD